MVYLTVFMFGKICSSEYSACEEHDQRYAIVPSKAMAELGWAPTTMFKDGIKLTIKWYKEPMDWMEECTSVEYVK